MLRKKAVAIAVSLLMPSVASALGLGALEASSGLNEPFDGRIEILGGAAPDYDTLSVKLADAQAFSRAGVLREAVLLSLKFDVVETPAGNDFIRITTREPVREPFLNFLIELNWANGRMVREYTVLLDPPLYDPNRRPQAAAAPMAATAPRPAATPAPIPAPAAPTAAGVGSITAGPTDTAWGLASRYRPDANVSVQRMMVAMLRVNPEAFIQGNLNLLRRGAVLKMPERAALDALSQAEAVAEVARQHQLWEDYRQGAARAAPEQPMGAPVEQAATEPGADILEEALADSATDGEAKLELVAPETDAATGAQPGEAADSGALVEENLSAKSQENDELRAKLDEASEIIDLLQRQVELKDNELASLQSRLAELGVGGALPPATGAAPAAEPAPAPAPQPAAPPPAVPAPPAAAAKPAPVPAKPAAPPPEPTPGFLDGLLPPYVRDAVPGGAFTIFGVAGSLLLLAIAAIARSLGRGRGKAITSSARPAAAAAAAMPGREAEPAVPAPAAPVEPVDLFARTLEASAEQLAPDPLEEVNVYLAYERFDQAEELVKKVIQQYPNEHKYKLRLLEIYYSANDRQAYEQYARALLDAVGEQHPLWENALAMWNEMSPSRALFAPAAPEEAGSAAPAPKEFVDITGEVPASAVVGDTMSMAPGVESALAATAVGLTNEPHVSEGEVDFDIAGAPEAELGAPVDLELEPLLDVTGGEDQGATDLDATGDSAFVDLTGESTESGDSLGEIFDISGDGELDVATTQRIDGETFAAAAAATQRDLLDIANTEDVEFDAEAARQLSDTVESLAGRSAPPAAAPDTSAVDLSLDEGPLDLDISATLPPTDDVDDGPAPLAVDDDELTATGDSAAPTELDFDIEGLSLDFEPTVALQSAPPPAAEPTSGDGELDLSLELDTDTGHVARAEAAPSGEAGGLHDADFEFDIALQDTTDFDQLGIDDTLELPGSSGVRDIPDAGESLEDLTRSMEASLAGLDFDVDRTGDSLAELESVGTDALEELDFSVGDVGGDSEGAESLGLAGDELPFERTGIRLGGDAGLSGLSHEGDEVDTKLNLAKAYLELGDNEGARTILDEVSREGSEAQQLEARQLLSQLA